MGKAPCFEKMGLRKGRWTTEEDEILTKYIAENGEGSWKSLPKNAGLLRCAKSCRLRWINYLRGGIKRGEMSKEEDEIIIKLHTSVGNRWSFIARHLPGRTDNDIKNYWNSHLSRRIHRFRRQGDGEVVIVDLGTVPGGHKRGARALNKGSSQPTNSQNASHAESRCRGEVEEPERDKSAAAVVEEEKTLCLELERVEAMLWNDDETPYDVRAVDGCSLEKLISSWLLS